jgi:hypothetical protein
MLKAWVPGSQQLGLCSSAPRSRGRNEAFDIAERHFPIDVNAGTISANDKIVVGPLSYDASTSKKALGFRYTWFEEQVKDIVEHNALFRTC